jgi:catechol 2,3-dioxygenase-like lactoylglutathione lyase family enzyme
MIRQSMHVIAVADLSASCAFYRDVLGFEVHEIGDAGWRRLVKDSCRIMAGECPSAMRVVDTGDHSYFAYFTVDDVDSLHQRATASGAEILKAPRDEPWSMREFSLRTIDGHRIMLGQRLDARTTFSGLDHVQLAAPPGCEGEGRRFFGEVLGLEELPKPAALAVRGGLWFQCGAQQIHIGVETDFRAAKKAHPAFRLTDEASLQALRTRMQAAGIATRDDREIEESARFFADDPWGNRLEFVAARAT